MAVIPEKYLQQLRAAGLLVSEPFGSDHTAFPDGVVVAKPAGIPGNSIQGYSGVANDQPIDAPGLWFHSNGSEWVVTMQEYVPHPGPGDFVNKWESPEKAVADILDYYFGNPDRMEKQQQARSRPTESWEKRDGKWVKVRYPDGPSGPGIVVSWSSDPL